MTKPKKDDKGGKSKTPDKRLEVDDAQIRPKRNIRDSVFTDLLSFKKYALALYKAIHPEDKDVAEDDIEIVTLRRVFAYGRYNDFSMRVRGKVIIIVEAQSTWSFNVVPRLFFYLGLHWNSQFAGAANQKLYQKEPVELDDPELYVLYSGKGDFPRRLSMRELFFHGNPDKPDLVAKVISGNPNAKVKTFLDEFAFFERVYLQQLAEKIPIPKAILNTINTCVEAGVLVEYLEERRAEVECVMKKSYKRDYEMLARIADAVKENETVLNAEHAEEITKLNEENAKRVKRARTVAAKENSIAIAKNLLSLGTLSVDQIARTTGLPVASVTELAGAF